MNTRKRQRSINLKQLQRKTLKEIYRLRCIDINPCIDSYASAPPTQHTGHLVWIIEWMVISFIVALVLTPRIRNFLELDNYISNSLLSNVLGIILITAIGSTVLITVAIIFTIFAVKNKKVLQMKRGKIRQAEVFLQSCDIRQIICPSLQSVPNDALEISKAIIPNLATAFVDEVIEIPLEPLFLAAVAVVIARLDHRNICSGYIK